MGWSMEIELHESQTKVAEQSAVLLVQQAHLQQQEAAMLDMQRMMAMMRAQMALIPAVPPQAPSVIVARTTPLTTRARLTFPGLGVPPVNRTSNLTTPPTAPPPAPASYRQADVARRHSWVRSMASRLQVHITRLRTGKRNGHRPVGCRKRPHTTPSTLRQA